MADNKHQIQTFDKPGALMEYLKRASGQIGMALPKHLNVDRMLRLAVTAFSTQPKLRECSGQSILSSLIVASQMGLEIGVRGQGFLVPYKGVCTFVPGWQGLVSLLNNSGRATAWTGAVFRGDDFQYELGAKPVLRHVPGDNHGDPEMMTHAYACGQVNGSQMPVIECWTVQRIWKHRDRYNKQGQNHYSFREPEMYARKVVLLQVLKYLPVSIELQNAMTAAEAAEIGKTTYVDGGVVLEADIPESDPEKPEFTQKPQTQEPPAKEQQPKLTDKTQEAPAPQEDFGKRLVELYTAAGFNEGEMTLWARSKSLIRENQELPDISEKKLRTLVEGWENFLPEIKAAFQNEAK